MFWEVCIQNSGVLWAYETYTVPWCSGEYHVGVCGQLANGSIKVCTNRTAEGVAYLSDGGVQGRVPESGGGVALDVGCCAGDLGQVLRVEEI